jgi:hypothetical protein
MLGVWIVFQGEIFFHSWDHCCGADEHAAHHSDPQDPHQSEDCEFCQLFHSPFVGSNAIHVGICAIKDRIANSIVLSLFPVVGYEDIVTARGPPVV